MLKTIKLLKISDTSSSLTWVVMLCASMLLSTTSAEARRMNPVLIDSVDNNQIKTQSTPVAGIMCKDCTNTKPPTEAPSGRVWQAEVRDIATWKQLSKPLRDAEFSKFVIDLKTNKIYFVDSNVFMLHADFVVDYLKKIPRTVANMKAYNRNYSTKKPQFILGYLTHYPKLDLSKQDTNATPHDLWTFSFWEGDTIQAQDIQLAYKRLQQTFTVAPLVFRPDSSEQERVANQLKSFHIPTINNNQIYQSLPYQAFNTGSAIGRLVIVPPTTPIENLTFDEDDIVLLQSSYPDISPVAGVITTQFSTPLSHVNLRASAWGVPNATIKSAANEFKGFDGKQVVYEVTEAGYHMRLATEVEVTQHKNNKLAKAAVVMPAADLTTTALLPLNKISAEDANKYGAKTSNLGEMVRANNNLNIPDGFGIPFSYYLAHIKLHHIDQLIVNVLNDPKFKQDANWRKKHLEDIRFSITNAPLALSSFNKIQTQWQKQLGGRGVFVRSSTNAEDLKGFNGAGLYDTVPNVKDKKALEAAIKQVWASVWNLRAVEERTHFGIPHEQVYPAVLIQSAVNAAAAGVLLTTDIWGHQTTTYTINAKWGLGMRVVEGQKIAEQILFDTSNNGTRVISRSDESTMLVANPKGGMMERPVTKGTAILTEKRAKMLGQAAQHVAEIFNQTDVLDIEWVLETQSGQDVFWIVQARPYVTNKY
ncbi:PEP/pyruvate-binding domain-containing protein [Methylotenera sp.]|uniref:PEP/pyruvate-binding domain-containing protein n=1 Tax=Methylotenera sp. TaxID=2051956 RepID=UPI002487EEE6|nr:PEP/pyruvate-binding domain-containing protein [Methylotenera sp.]MDI1299088.1 PEP/pyruvate-binding domain-containing protein [Methylotenera sp.]